MSEMWYNEKYYENFRMKFKEVLGPKSDPFVRLAYKKQSALYFGGGMYWLAHRETPEFRSLTEYWAKEYFPKWARRQARLTKNQSSKASAKC
jgi:hypothetical protein